MKTRTIVLALIAVTAGVFTYTRPHNPVPSDLRDAVADNSALDALKGSPGPGVADIKIPEPETGQKAFSWNTDKNLIYAAFEGRAEKVKMLIAGGADVNSSRIAGYTALMAAADKGHAEIVKILLASGARPDMQTTAYGDTALTIAVKRGHAEIAGILASNGADVNIKTRYADHDTALIIAIRNGHAEIAEMLASKGAALNVKTRFGDTALIIAADEGREEIAGMLIAKGADINVKNTHGDTALSIALYERNMRIVKMLTDSGALMPETKSRGMTPADADQAKTTEINGAGGLKDAKQQQQDKKWSMQPARLINAAADDVIRYGIRVDQLNTSLGSGEQYELEKALNWLDSYSARELIASLDRSKAKKLRNACQDMKIAEDLNPGIRSNAASVADKLQ